MRAKTIPQRQINRAQNVTVPQNTAAYTVLSQIGSGTFGSIFAIQLNDGTKLALKKVRQDPKYKNRELSIISKIKHPNCLAFIASDIKYEGENHDQEYLYLFTDLLPIDLHKHLRKFKYINIDLAKIFGYQLFNGLDYLHKNNITHRDIKSSNVLVDPDTGRLEICDFGSAKELRPNEVSVSYISTRSYRAPELLYNSEFYTSKIDVWAAGCVLSEMFKQGEEIFHADSNENLKNVIIKYIGTPTEQDFQAMGLKCQLGYIYKGEGIERAFPQPLDPLLLDLLKHIFVFSPIARYNAEQVKNHPFFEVVRRGQARLPNGSYFNVSAVNPSY